MTNRDGLRLPESPAKAPNPSKATPSTPKKKSKLSGAGNKPELIDLTTKPSYRLLREAKEC